MLIKILFIEFVVSLCLGGWPIIYAYSREEGPSSVVTVLNSLMPSEILVTCSLILTLIALAIEVGYRCILKKHDTVTAIWKLAYSISSEIAPGSLGVLRIGTGVLLSYTALWAIEDPGSMNWKAVSGFLMLGLLTLTEAVFLRWSMLKLAKRWPKNVNELRQL